MGSVCPGCSILHEGENTFCDSCLQKQREKLESKKESGIQGILAFIGAMIVFGLFQLLYVAYESISYQNIFSFMSLYLLIQIFVLSLISIHFFTKSNATKTLLILTLVPSLVLWGFSFVESGFDFENIDITLPLIKDAILLVYVIKSQQIIETFITPQSVKDHIVKIVFALCFPLIILFMKH